MTNQQEIFFKEVLPRATKDGKHPIVSRKELISLCNQFGIKWIPVFAQKVRSGRGMFDLSYLLKEPLSHVGTSSASRVPDTTYTPAVDERTDHEIEKEIADRFEALDQMALGITNGKYRCLIASGNPGIGKTYNLEYILKGAADDEKISFTSIRGYVKPTGLYKLLWESREKGSVLMFDDADSVFGDEIGLNLLKSALDTTKRRTISWHSEKIFEDEAGEDIPKSFDFNGCVVFITNLDFDKAVRASSKLAPHLEALISRSYYMDLNLSFPRELMVRVKNVVRKTDMLGDLNESARESIIDYMERNMHQMRELSLRMALKLAKLWQGSKNREAFERIAMATCLKRKA